jgi:hypothetical protein
MGPRFDLLANACEFALSRQTVPNFICRATTQRSRNGNPLDVITGDVTFARGGADRYTNLAVDGHPISSWRDAPPGWWSGALFGNLLTTIFSPATKASFKFRREVNAPSGPSTVFDFHFKSADNSTFLLLRSYPGLSGSVWVDRKSGQLQRVEASATELDPNGRVGSYHSSVKYGVVAIPDLGNFLAPTAAEVEGCFRGGACFRNVLSFHDCRRFGSEVRIVPNPEP